MDFKVGDWVITSEDCYCPNIVGFIKHLGYSASRVTNRDGLKEHYWNPDNGDFHLWIDNNYLKPYYKKQQLEFSFE